MLWKYDFNWSSLGSGPLCSSIVGFELNFVVRCLFVQKTAWVAGTKFCGRNTRKLMSWLLFWVNCDVFTRILCCLTHFIWMYSQAPIWRHFHSERRKDTEHTFHIAVSFYRHKLRCTNSGTISSYYFPRDSFTFQNRLNIGRVHCVSKHRPQGRYLPIKIFWHL